MDYPKIFKDYRKKNNFTRQQAAYKLGINESYLCMLEKGQRSPKRGAIVMIVNAIMS